MRHVEARYAEWVVAARRPIIAATLILVAIASSGILFLKFTADYRIFFSETILNFVHLKRWRMRTGRATTSSS